jgi:hypothetical protein
MSEGDICSDDEKYGGFGAAVANSLHRRDRSAPTRAVAADSAAPAPAMAAAQSVPAPAVAAARSGTKKPPPVAVAERTWLTKRPASWLGLEVRCEMEGMRGVLCDTIFPPRHNLGLRIFNSYVRVIQNKTVFGTLVRILP